MDKEEFLKKVDELYQKYESTNMGDVDAWELKEALYELVVEYKGGEL
ncbi:hypothetical protein [Peribacillus loiseleuriae]